MDWMHLVFAAAATGCGGLAWGYRTQAANEREQITFLRRQLGCAEGQRDGSNSTDHTGAQVRGLLRGETKTPAAGAAAWKGSGV